MTNNDKPGRGSYLPLFLVGGLLLVVGALFALNQFELLSFNWGIVWPLLLVAVGIVFLIRDVKSGIWWAPIVILIGVGFFIVNIGLVSADLIGSLWPFFIVLVGLAFIVTAFFRMRDRNRSSDSNDSGTGSDVNSHE